MSLKTYLGNVQARDWFTSVASRTGDHPAVTDGIVELFVIPTYLQIHDALSAFAESPVRIGAQDVSAYEPGPFTGEVAAAELAEIGVAYAEIGHAERRRLLGETEDVIAEKMAVALRHGITPVLCVGEGERLDSDEAARATAGQVRSALELAPAGRIIVAYEPVWAIGASIPAPIDHIRTVTVAIRAELAALQGREGSSILYGGSAGPGLLTDLGATVDGVFLGRFAHDPDNLTAVLDEALGSGREHPQESTRGRWNRSESRVPPVVIIIYLMATISAAISIALALLGS
ncbi:triosephosphate isomerase [Microbacterium trichothecenolyticum]|uniref:triose-phosphate isomerase family protein n=1 Tax=Microbacterium trichothecenolyticum TaxID=69370 RepID=UPI00285C62F0|nr:triose-phosphate isomerase family protein [Microbacterium trichothecenolyticum]MDR7187137.1 triosephosphate isomerase [Microbacterium trichothecenolyticum]